MIRPSNQTGPQHKLCDRAASSPQFNHVTTVDQWVYQWVLVSVLLCGSVPHSEQQSVQFFLCRFLFECRCLRAHRALYGSLHQPGGQVDGEERPAGRPQPVPPDPALRFHPDPPAGGTTETLFIHKELNYRSLTTQNRQLDTDELQREEKSWKLVKLYYMLEFWREETSCSVVQWSGTKTKFTIIILQLLIWHHYLVMVHPANSSIFKIMLCLFFHMLSHAGTSQSYNNPTASL